MIQSMAAFLFGVNLSWLVLHELDAIQEHEWRFFLPFLNDRVAYRIFALIHLPLLALMIVYAGARPFQIGFDLFMLIHTLLHWLLRNHPRIEFRNGFSRAVIACALPLAMAHLGLLLA